MAIAVTSLSRRLASLAQSAASLCFFNVYDDVFGEATGFELDFPVTDARGYDKICVFASFVAVIAIITAKPDAYGTKTP